MRSTALPLLDRAPLHTPIAWRDGQGVSRALFMQHVACIARALPAARFLLNLCEDRYLFLAAFAAVGANGQTNLLPSSRAELHVRRLADLYPDSASIGDGDIKRWLQAGDAGPLVPAIPQIASDHLMALAFTSGSTGQATSHPKTWGELVSGAGQAQQRFGFDQGMTLVATVPPQHMYGLETSVMTALASGACVHSGRPFFPEDIRAALAAATAPRVLVTTPIHLQACMQAELSWPQPAFVLSATAPLAAPLAAQAEAAFHAPVLEIYGCTEAGSIASRRTLDGDHWRLYDGFQLRGPVLSGAHLPEPVPLNDLIEPGRDGQFRLLGRQKDLINIAGKRASLAALNQQLAEIEGVVEGLFLPPDEADPESQRLWAVVVAPDLSERQLIAALALRLDPVFLPRPLLKVTALPRNETGKVTREALRTLLRPDSSTHAPSSP